MKKILILGLSLGLICFIAAAVLTFAKNLTQDAREQVRLNQRFEAMEKVFSEAKFNEETEPIEINTQDGKFLYYPARANGELIGFAGSGVSEKGYGGKLKALVAIELETGQIRHVIVINHKETPGLGTRVTDRQERKTLSEVFHGLFKKSANKPQNKLASNEFLDQFEKRPLPEEKYFTVVGTKDEVQDPVGDVVAITGATVSSKAVADAVSRILATYHENKEKIINSATP